MSETSAGVGALRSLLRDTTIAALVAIATVALLGLTNEPVRDLAGWLRLKSVDGSAYDVLLETVAATTGVFLALYFTAVAAIAATVYAAVPHDIRALIVRDRLGNIYVRGVAFTMALAVLLLVAHAGADATYPLALPIIGFGALFSIFSFIRLGQRAFYLADPTLLADELRYQFFKWFDRAKHGGWRADEPAVQDNYRQHAKQNVDSLVSLAKLASGQPHLRGDSSRQLSSKIGALLVRYLSERHRVPSQSRWYGERVEHPQWYLTDYVQVQMAGATGALIPRTAPDVKWVEADLLRPLMSSVTADVKAADYGSAFAGLKALSRVWVGLGAVWASEDAARWVEELTTVFLPAVAETASGEIERPELVPGVLDLLALVPLSLELGFQRSIVDHDITTLGDRIAESDWQEPGAAYAFSLPRPVIQTLEQIRDGLEFESGAKARPDTRTPGWWIREMAMHSHEWAFHNEIEALVSLLVRWYPDTADALTDARLYEAAAAVLARGQEATLRLDAHLTWWEEVANAMRGEPRLDLKRPTWDWMELRARVNALRRLLDERLARSIVELTDVPESDDLPDYLGHAVHRTGEACFEALAGDDAELFTKLFPPYFVGILAVIERVRPRVAHYHVQHAVTAMAAPFMELLDIGGYAMIYSKLHGTPELWQTANEMFDRYCAPPEGVHRMKLMAAVHKHQRTSLGLTSRSMLRQRWKQSLSGQLSSLKRKAASDVFGPGEVDHENALIRCIAPKPGRISSFHFNASDIFVVLYLSNLPAANGLDFGIADWVVRKLDELTDADETDEAS